MAAFTVTTHVPVPEQPPPLHPTNVEPLVGVAVSVTTVPKLYGALHVAPQLIPAGALVTVPAPVPDLLTDNANDCRLNVAVTLCAAFIVTTQVPVPEQPPPLHPAKVEPADAAAVSVTTVAPGNDALHVAPQLIPAGALVTVPVPVPAFETVNDCGSRSNWALTVAAAFTVTTHVPVPEQPPPLQPMNEEPAVADAVSVTTVPKL